MKKENKPAGTEGDDSPSIETVTSHLAALAWRDLRQLPKKPGLLK